MAARHVLDLAAITAAQLAAVAATTERAIASLSQMSAPFQPYRPAPHPDADTIADELAGRIAAEPGGPPVPAGGVTWQALWRWWADLPADAADPLADAVDTAIMDLVGGPDSNLPDDPAERALWQMTLDLASPEIALSLARHLDTWLWPDTPPELPETWAADLNTATIAAVALDASVRHPLRPLIRAYLDAHRPAAKPDRWPRATMPRLVTAERAGAPARIEVARDAADRPAALTIPGLGSLDLPAVPGLAYLPGLAPPNATPAGVVPAAWLAIIDGMAATHSDAREWQRALRLLIEIVSAPDPRQRRGLVHVDLPVGGSDGIIRRLWPTGPHVRQHYPALRRALGLAVSAALPASDGRAYLPAQLDRWQRPDALRFNVTYPTAGGGGAAYDRHLFRRYGVHPRTFRVYLAAVWALDARQLRRRDGDAWLADLPLDALADLVSYPNVPRSYVERRDMRTLVRAALERLAVDGAIGGYDLAGRGSRQRLALWRPRPALPAPPR